ncbi:MAG: ComEC/Rec2 family competence protein [Anaerolineales bacterium]|nr:ComEC/Rec2 family competence protein [Anaerolineales bacterium]
MRRGGVYALIGLSAAWLAGIACASTLHLNPLQWTLVAVGFGAGALVCPRPPRLRLAFVAGALFCLGGLRLLAAQPRMTPDFLTYYAGIQQPLTLTGVVAAFPEESANWTTLRLRVDSVLLDGDFTPRAVRGLAVISGDRSIRWSYGDRLQAHGLLHMPEASDRSRYEAFLARQGIQGWMPQATTLRLATRQGSLPLHWLDDLRRRGLETLQRLFPDPEAGLLAGILLGVESGISDEVMRAFNRTNTSHIIAISGFNIAILSAIFVQTFGRLLGARRGAWAAVIAIAGYTVLVGASASVVRAAWMAGLALLARWLGRTADALLTLMASALLMTVIHPATLFDVGFQLSFAATLGLILYAAPLQARADAWFTRWLPPAWVERAASPLAGMLLITLAAQATTLPLTVYYFQRLSLISLVANPVILPLQPPLMILGGSAMLVGMVWPLAAQPLAWAAWPFAALTIRAVEFFSSWPAGSIALGQTSAWVVVAFYLLLFGGTALARGAWPQQAAEMSASLARAAGPALLGLGAILVWKAGIDRPDGRLSLTVLDSERGQGVLLTSPTGRTLLVGGGADPAELRQAIGRRLPLLDRSLDWLILGSSDSDSLTGLNGISQHVRVDGVLICGTRRPRSLSLLEAELAGDGAAIESAAPGQRFDLGMGAALEVLAVSEHGCLLLAQFGRARFLLAPGADPDLIQAQMHPAAPPALTGYVAASGGHLAVNPPEWIEALSPRAVVLAGDPAPAAENPALRTVANSRGIRLIDTMTYGWVWMETDGERLWISTERGAP